MDRKTYFADRSRLEKVGHLFWERVCVECGQVFKQRRAGRPRVTCDVECREARMHRSKPWNVHKKTCVTCRNGQTEVCGAGFMYCPTTGWHFRKIQGELALEV